MSSASPPNSQSDFWSNYQNCEKLMKGVPNVQKFNCDMLMYLFLSFSSNESSLYIVEHVNGMVSFESLEALSLFIIMLIGLCRT